MDAHSVENYMLGKGIVYANVKDENGVLRGEIDLGNCPDFTATLELDKLEHFSSRAGLKVKDKVVIRQITETIKMKLEEINLRNLKIAFQGTDVTVTQTAGAVTNEAVAVKDLNAYYKLVKRKLLAIPAPVVSMGVLTPVEGTDYNIDYNIGRFYPIDGGMILEDCASITIDYSYDDLDMTGFAIGTRNTIEGSLRFVGEPAEGQQYELEIWNGQFTIDGDLGLISDDWATLGLNFEVLADEVGHPDSPLGVVYELPVEA